MKLNDIKNINNCFEFFVEMDYEEWKKCQDKATKKLGKNVRIPGYRPGKAPVEVLRKNINESRILTDAASSAIDEMLEWLVETKDFESKLNDFFDNSPQTGIEKIDIDTIVAKFSFPIWPEIKINYKDLKLEEKLVEASDKDVEKEIEKLLAREKMVVPKEGAIEKDDIAVINFKGFIDGKPFDGGEAKNYELKIGSKSFIDNFEDQLIGLKSGDKKDVNVTFPKDYHVSDLANKKAKFEVEINVVNKIELPKLDDEFVKNLKIENVNTVSELKKHLKKDIDDKNKNNFESKREQELFTKLIDGSEIKPETPQYLIDRVYSSRIRYFMNQFNAKTPNDLDNILRSFGLNYATFEMNQKNEISRTWKLSTLLREIAKLENIEPKKEEQDKKIEIYAKDWKLSNEEISKDMLIMRTINTEIIKEKAFQFLKDLYFK